LFRLAELGWDLKLIVPHRWKDDYSPEGFTPVPLENLCGTFARAPPRWTVVLRGFLARLAGGCGVRAAADRPTSTGGLRTETAKPSRSASALRDDPDVRAATSAAARRSAQPFDWERITDRFETLYAELATDDDH
jgi:hypothetical protein